jgi:hypothetical protein
MLYLKVFSKDLTTPFATGHWRCLPSSLRGKANPLPHGFFSFGKFDFLTIWFLLIGIAKLANVVKTIYAFLSHDGSVNQFFYIKQVEATYIMQLLERQFLYLLHAMSTGITK